MLEVLLGMQFLQAHAERWIPALLTACQKAQASNRDARGVCILLELVGAHTLKHYFMSKGH